MIRVSRSALGSPCILVPSHSLRRHRAAPVLQQRDPAGPEGGPPELAAHTAAPVPGHRGARAGDGVELREVRRVAGGADAPGGGPGGGAVHEHQSPDPGLPPPPVPGPRHPAARPGEGLRLQEHRHGRDPRRRPGVSDPGGGGGVHGQGRPQHPPHGARAAVLRAGGHAAVRTAGDGAGTGGGPGADGTAGRAEGRGRVGAGQGGNLRRGAVPVVPPPHGAAVRGERPGSATGVSMDLQSGSVGVVAVVPLSPSPVSTHGPRYRTLGFVARK